MHNPRIKLAKYAVRGALPQRAAKMAKRIRNGEDLKLPFDRLLWCNVRRRFDSRFTHTHASNTDWKSHGSWNETVEFLSKCDIVINFR